MSHRTTTRYLLGAIAGLAVVGVSTAGAMVLTDLGADTSAGTPLPAVTTSVPAVPMSGGTPASPVTVSSSGATAVVTAAAGTTSAVTTDATAAVTTDADTAADTVTSEATAADTTAAAVGSEYADGTYTGTGSYSTPDGTESITVTVTLSGDVVTAVTATGSASGGTAGQFQSRFLTSYSAEVVGKTIDEVSLSRVAGSSLTSGGFNAAMEEIRSDAQA